jgi:hypothetical protein
MIEETAAGRGDNAAHGEAAVFASHDDHLLLTNAQHRWIGVAPTTAAPIFVFRLVLNPSQQLRDG